MKSCNIIFLIIKCTFYLYDAIFIKKNNKVYHKTLLFYLSKLFFQKWKLVQQILKHILGQCKHVSFWVTPPLPLVSLCKLFADPPLPQLGLRNI